MRGFVSPLGGAKEKKRRESAHNKCSTINQFIKTSWKWMSYFIMCEHLYWLEI
jgi:hypothetical protein